MQTARASGLSVLAAAAAVAALLLLLAVTICAQQTNKLDDADGPKFEDLFEMGLPQSNYRRQNVMSTPTTKRTMTEPENFFEPYHYRGDEIFLRTTHAYLIKNIKDYRHWEFYNSASILDYRECNLVCPDLYLRFGKVCGWRLYYNGYHGWKHDRVRFVNGYYNQHKYNTFDNLCAMLTANCQDLRNVPPHGKKVSKVRELWRLVHLGACPEEAEQVELLSPSSYNFGYNESYWSKKTNELLEVSKIGYYPTRPSTLSY